MGTIMASQPTRQQLDDLDALLQRMLALPVNSAEEPAPPDPEPLAAPAGNVILSDPARPVPRPVPLPLLNPLPPAERRSPVLPPPDRPLSPRQALAASRPPAPPLLLRPVLWLNRRFDGFAFGLGSTGRWLRRPVGRTLLGLVGLLLLAAAVAVVLLDRFGWTW
jgi:hypothetical protein